MNKKRILITGANGVIGRFLADKYHKMGHEVVGIDDYSNSDQEHSEFLIKKADAAEFLLVDRLCKNVDIIFHCCCAPCEGFSNVSPCFIGRSILDTTLAVASAAGNNDVKLIYNFTSMARYGNNPNLPFTEDMLTSPVDPYGASKVAAENILNTMSKIYGFKVIHIVPHNVFGLRSRWDDPQRGVLPIFTNQALLGLPLTIFNDGNQKRSFSFVEDAFSFYEDFLNIDIDNGEVYNVGPDDESSMIKINDLADLVLDLTKSKSEKVYIEKKNDVHLAYASSNKIREKFGWKSQVNLVNEIEKIVKNIMQKGPKKFRYNRVIEIEKFCPSFWKNNV